MVPKPKNSHTNTRKLLLKADIKCSMANVYHVIQLKKLNVGPVRFTAKPLKNTLNINVSK